MNTAFFRNDIFFYDDSLQVSGVFIFNDSSKQPDPKKHVQHLYIKCTGNNCVSVESYLTGKSIHIETRDVKLLELNYSEKTATFEAFGCRISVNQKSAGFACKDGDVGAIGSHISMFYDRYALWGK